MISVKANNRTVEIPSFWEELTAGQYIATVDLLQKLMEKQMPLMDFRLKLLQVLAGYQPSRRYNTHRERINENLYLVSELIQFPLKPVYENPDILSVLSPELQALLEFHFPHDITDPKWEGELRMIRGRIRYAASVNFSMKSNPLPFFEYHHTKFLGPAFNIDSLGIVETDLKAMEYIDASEYYQLFQKTRMRRYLDRLVSTIYRVDRERYKTFECQQKAVLLAAMDESVKHAVLFFFQNIQEFLANHPVYKYLFQKVESNSGKISLGMVTTVYNLSKEGYGTKQQVSEMGLEDYLNMLLKTIMDSIRSLKAQKKPDHDIASELNIPSELIYKV
jgi:hypothetical protein